MKRTISYITLLALSAAFVISCEKKTSTNQNEASYRYWQAWVEAQKADHPDYLWRKTALGSYILEDTGGGGTALGSSELVPYVYLNYTATDLDGTITESNIVSVAKQLGTYSPSNCYDPVLKIRGEGNMPAGIDELVAGMCPGQKVKAVVPAWLNAGSKRYDSEQEYIKNVTGTAAIYELEVLDGVVNYQDFQIAQILKAARARYNKFIDAADTVKSGVYYIRLQEPTDTAGLKPDASAYVNYTGRYLNGQAFDTTLKDTAKVNNIYSAGKTYSAQTLNWAENDEDITMGSGEGSSLIDGFKDGIAQMKYGEKGVVLFISDKGYGNNGNNPIPGFCPLMFELELLKESN